MPAMQRICPDCHAVYLYDSPEHAPAHCSKCGRPLGDSATASAPVAAAEVRSPTEKFFHSSPHPTDETGPTELGHAAVVDDEPWLERPQKRALPWTPIIVALVLVALAGGLAFMLLRSSAKSAAAPDLTAAAVIPDLAAPKVDATVASDLAHPPDLAVGNNNGKGVGAAPPVEVVEDKPAAKEAPKKPQPKPHHSKTAAPPRSLPRPPPTAD